MISAAKLKFFKEINSMFLCFFCVFGVTLQ